MIPIPPQLAAWAATKAAKKALFWIKAGALVGLVAAVAFAGHRVTVWHESHLALKATEKAMEACKAETARYAAAEASAWQALREAEGKAKAKEATDRATAERIEHDLQTKLAAADARGRDLARRLLDATRAARSGPGPVSSPAGTPAEPAIAGGEPGSDEALGAVFAACTRDAERLNGWIEWWRSVETQP